MATNNVFRMVSNNSLAQLCMVSNISPWGVNRAGWGVIFSRWSKRGELFEGWELLFRVGNFAKKFKFYVQFHMTMKTELASDNNVLQLLNNRLK